MAFHHAMYAHITVVHNEEQSYHLPVSVLCAAVVHPFYPWFQYPDHLLSSVWVIDSESVHCLWQHWPSINEVWYMHVVK